MSLRIDDLHWEDEGKYELEAVNPGGRATSYTTLLTTSDCSVMEAHDKINGSVPGQWCKMSTGNFAGCQHGNGARYNQGQWCKVPTWQWCTVQAEAMVRGAIIAMVQGGTWAMVQGANRNGAKCHHCNGARCYRGNGARFQQRNVACTVPAAQWRMHGSSSAMAHDSGDIKALVVEC